MVKTPYAHPILLNSERNVIGRQYELGAPVTPRRRRNQVLQELSYFALLIGSAQGNYIKGLFSRPADDVARMELFKNHFGGHADAITARDIKRVLCSLTAERHWSASSRNQHQSMTRSMRASVDLQLT